MQLFDGAVRRTQLLLGGFGGESFTRLRQSNVDIGDGGMHAAQARRSFRGLVVGVQRSGILALSSPYVAEKSQHIAGFGCCPEQVLEGLRREAAVLTTTRVPILRSLRQEC